MKKTSLLFISLFAMLFGFESMFGQSKTTIKNSFVIHGTDINQADLDFFTKSIEAVDLEKYRARTTSVFLEFRNHFTLELISAEKLVNAGSALDLSTYSDILSNEYRYPIFRIDDSGVLVTMHRTKITKAQLNETSK